MCAGRKYCGATAVSKGACKDNELRSLCASLKFGGDGELSKGAVSMPVIAHDFRISQTQYVFTSWHGRQSCIQCVLPEKSWSAIESGNA